MVSLVVVRARRVRTRRRTRRHVQGRGYTHQVVDGVEQRRERVPHGREELGETSRASRAPARRDVETFRRCERARHEEERERGTRRAHHRWGGGPVRAAGREGTPSGAARGEKRDGGEMLAREEDHGVSVRCVRRSEKRRTPRSGEVEKDARSLGCRTARRATSLETATSAARADAARWTPCGARIVSRDTVRLAHAVPRDAPRLTEDSPLFVPPTRVVQTRARAEPCRAPRSARRAVAASSSPRPRSRSSFAASTRAWTDPPRAPANPPRRASPGGSATSCSTPERTRPSRPSRPSRPRPTTPSTPTSHRRPFPFAARRASFPPPRQPPRTPPTRAPR